MPMSEFYDFIQTVKNRITEIDASDADVVLKLHYLINSHRDDLAAMENIHTCNGKAKDLRDK